MLNSAISFSPYILFLIELVLESYIWLNIQYEYSFLQYSLNFDIFIKFHKQISDSDFIWLLHCILSWVSVRVPTFALSVTTKFMAWVCRNELKTFQSLMNCILIGKTPGIVISTFQHAPKWFSEPKIFNFLENFWLTVEPFSQQMLFLLELGQQMLLLLELGQPC